MKYLLFLLCSLTVLLAKGQEKYYTKNGHAYFMSQTDAINIDGNNKQVVSFLDVKTGDLAFAVLVKSFEFTLATAAEHFNETYMESHLYPKANFKGKIADLTKIDFSKPGLYTVPVEGALTLHGVTKSIKELAIFEVKNMAIVGKSSFTVAINDYNIKVPKVVEHRVAKNVNVKIECEYKPYQK